MRVNKITASLIVVLIFGGMVVSASADQSATLDNNLRREALVRAAEELVRNAEIVAAEKITVTDKAVPFDHQEGEGIVEQFSYPKDMTTETAQADDAAGTVDITTAFVASSTPNVPCFECVEGALLTGVGLPFPLKSVNVGDRIEFVVTVDPLAIDGAVKGLLWFSIVTDELEPIATDAAPIILLPNVFYAVSFFNRTVPDFPVESADIVALIVDEQLQTLATYVGLDAVNIRP